MKRRLELARDLLVRPRTIESPELHLERALEWLYAAQDAGSDRGVSHSYVIGTGWLPSYPETTGYIIPTLLNVWEERGREEARRRALEMAEWELTVQLPDGAIPALAGREPAVFDTGQVLFGWIAAHQVSGESRFLEAAVRAGDWMVRTMDADGVWRKFTAGSAGSTFYVRAAWALLELSLAGGSGAHAEAARRALEWSLGQERDEGWFAGNCLNDVERPLLHTIAYTAQGQLEGGLRLDHPLLVEAATRTARGLAARIDSGGFLAGRFARGWRPAARWACLTGMAQMSLVWSRLFALTGEAGFRSAAERVNRFLQTIQDLRSRETGLRGGIRGSFPVNGGYCRYALPNWATKFFVDALLHAPATGRSPVYRG